MQNYKLRRWSIFTTSTISQYKCHFKRQVQLKLDLVDTIQLKTLILRIFMKCEFDVLYIIQNKIAEYLIIEDKILATNLEINESQNGEHNLNN